MQFQKGQYSLGNFCLVQCSLVQFLFFFSAKQVIVVQHGLIHCSAVQCSTNQWIVLICQPRIAVFFLCIHSAAQLLKALLWLHMHQYMILYMGRIHQDGYQYMNLVPSNYSSNLNLFCKSYMTTYLVAGMWGHHQKKKKYFYPLNTIEQKYPHKGDFFDMCGQQQRYQNKTKNEQKKERKMSCIMCQVLGVAWHVSHVACRLSHVTCHMQSVACNRSLVTCHLSLMPTAIATEPPNSPTIHSRLVCKDQKTPKISKLMKSLALDEI